MAITERTKRLLWARSGGFCQNPSCVRDLFVLFEDGSVSSIDELAHIIAQSVDGPRGHESAGPFDRDGHDNIAILCPSCHSCFAIIDGSSLDSSGEEVLSPGPRRLTELSRRPLAGPRRRKAESASRVTSEERT